MKTGIPDEIYNSMDIIDSRDIIERIDYLVQLQDDFQEDNELEDYPGYEESEEDSKWYEWDESEEGFELNKLQELTNEVQDYAEDWENGCILIRDNYFSEYAEELVKDIGDLPKDIPSYLYNNIDWDGVAEDIQQDYTEVDFDGVSYWVR